MPGLGGPDIVGGREMITGKSSRRVWSYEDLQVLNAVASPVWVFSCATNRTIWANKACLQNLGLGSLDKLLRLSKASIEDTGKLAALTQCVRREVEIGGGELVLSGDGPLPGVIVHQESHMTEYLYQQLMLSQPDSDTTLCTLVQAVHASNRQTTTNQMTTVQTSGESGLSKGSVPSSLDGKISRVGAAASLGMPDILDLVEGILAHRPVSMDMVQSLHQMLIRGELALQANNRMGEELLVKEELDQDVGLNLLQLLGSSTLHSSSEQPSDGQSDASGAPLSPTLLRRGLGNHGLVKSSAGNESSGSLQLLAGSDDEEGVQGPVLSLLPAMEAVLGTVDDWRFDAFKLAEATAGHPMSALGFWLIKRAGLLDSLQLDGRALARFLRKVEDCYPDNCYHNKTHAADVLQSMHVLMTRGGLLRRLGDDTPLIMLGGYLAAIIHDNEHRGLNNDFLVRVSDDLALTYNDTSPMENHHVAAAFRVMRTPSFNFIKRLSRDRLARLRRLLIEMVLATDMKQHFNILSKFQAKLQVKLRSSSYQSVCSQEPALSGRRSEATQEDALLVEDEVDRSLVMQVALKCADVGHLAAPWEVHHRWVSGLEEEFFRQGDRERAAHLMVSPLMDRCKDGITKSQVGFFDIVALPLFYSWAAVFNEALPLVRAVEDNCNRWRLLEAGRNGHGSK